MPDPNKLIDDMIAATPDWRGATLAKLRKLIREADSGIVEDVKWKRPGNPLGVAVFEHAGMVCFGGILKERVRLTFNAGASLPDPHKLFNAMLEGNKTRGVDFYEGDKIDAPALKALVRSGVGYNLAKLKSAKARS